MKAVLLCGGRGMRLAEFTHETPKPLVPVGDRPIVEWIIAHCVEHGIDDVALALGYLGERFHEWAFGDDRALLPPTAVRARSGRHPFALSLVDTGADTDTGGRVHRMRDTVGDDTFLLTYGDGLSDVDLSAALEFHRSHGRLVTVTAIRPRTTFGVLDMDAQGAVTAFREKPKLDVWTNGGFFLCEPGVFEYTNATCNFERHILPKLVDLGQMAAWRHEGFWGCMDTAKDRAELHALLTGGASPVVAPRW